MNLSEFDGLVSKIKAEKQALFGLDSDTIPTSKNIEAVEKYYGIKLSNKYREFLLKYGGGYFGLIIVYSIDEKSPFYIADNVEINFVKQRKFLPVIDFETGDTAGFIIHNNMCEEEVSVYNHEDDTLTSTKHDLFEVLAQYGLKVITK